jgi:acyl carrier protein
MPAANLRRTARIAALALRCPGGLLSFAASGNPVGENTVMASAADDIVEMITDRISPTSDALQLSEPLDKLGLDSMQVVELIFDIEEKFDIQIPLNANMDIDSKTVGDLIQAVDKLVAAKAKPN